MKLSEREQVLLFVLGIVAILVIGINYILLPNLNSYQELQLELDNMINRQIEVQGLLQKATTIDEQLKKANEETLEVIKPFLPELDAEYIDTWLHEMAAGTGVEITSLNLTTPTPQSVSPYTVDEFEITYPIKEYYQVITAEEQELVEQQQTNLLASGVEGKDSVLQVVVNIGVKGTNESILKLVDRLNTQDISLSINSFGVDEEIAYMNITFYMIDKENIDMNYHFNTPSGKNKIID